jgi:hypothetical protein
MRLTLLSFALSFIALAAAISKTVGRALASLAHTARDK